jgi:hypothetical protein
MEAGIPSLTRRLLQHSHLIPNNHPQFFLPKHFRYFLTKDGTPKVWSARNHLYMVKTKPLKRNSTLKTLESATGYLFWSTAVPQPLFCTCPWTKVIVMLRNPIDRIAAHYQSSTAMGMKMPLAEWIEADLELLLDAGVTAKATKESWSSYLASARGNGPVGRGLYNIQLASWIETMTDMSNTKVKEDLLVLNYDDWKRQPQEVWNQVLTFLKLPRDTAISLPTPTTGDKESTNDPILDVSLRKKLKKYFTPYNKKLIDLLGWDAAVWD